MRGARRGLEHGKAAIETAGDVNIEARKRNADAPVSWQTDVVHDEPQITAIAWRGSLRLTCDYAGDQASGRNGSGKLVQMEADSESCLERIVAWLASENRITTPVTPIKSSNASQKV